MLKKILAATVLSVAFCSTVSFAQPNCSPMDPNFQECYEKWLAAALGMVTGGGMPMAAKKTWDYFPVKPAGSGEAKLDFQYYMMGDFSTISTPIGVRYSIVEGLEAALFLPVIVGGDADAGLAEPAIGVRYWLPMGLGFFANFQVPFHTYDGDARMALYPGAQFSTKFTDELALGTELGLFVPLYDGNNGMNLLVGAEVDYTIGSITPYVGVGLEMGLTDGDGKAEKMGIDVTVGANFEISSSFVAGAYYQIGLGDGRTGGGDDMPMTIGATVSLNF
jgi:opacity protein-like surface antigen